MYASRDADAPDKLAIVYRIVDITRRHDERDDEPRIFVRTQEREIFRSSHLNCDCP
jgi:hypothetical protein